MICVAGRMLQFRSFPYRTAIATAASTVGIDHAQSPSIEIADAAMNSGYSARAASAHDLDARPRL